MREVDQHDAVLDDQSDEQYESHRRRDVQVRAGQQQQQKAPAERQWRREQDQHRGSESTELHDENDENERRGDAEHRQQFAERLLLRRRTGRRSRRVAHWQCAATASSPRISLTALPRSRFSRRAVTSAICRRFSRISSDLPVGRRSMCARRRAGTELPSPAAHRRVAPVCRDRTGTHRGSARARESFDRAAAARSRTSPSHASESCSADLLDGQPKRAAATGSMFHVISGLPRSTPTTSTTPVSSRASVSTCSREVRQHVGIVAENLDLDRRRAALEVAEHVLQQLDEFDFELRRRFRQLGAQVAMISSADRLRSPRGFSRTRMSPVFCCVANRPSSDPVRRE